MGTRQSPKALSWALVGLCEIIIAGIALMALIVNELAQAETHALITWTNDPDGRGSQPAVELECGTLSSDIDMEVKRWTYDTRARLNETCVEMGLSCADLNLNNRTCQSHDSYMYEQAYDDFCNGTAKSSGCKSLQYMAEYSETYSVLAIMASIMLCLTGLILMIKFICFPPKEKQKIYDDDERPEDPSFVKRCRSFSRITVIGLLNGIACAFYAVSWFFLNSAKDRSLRDSMEKSMDTLYGSDKDIELDYSWNRWEVGQSVYPLAFACVLSGLVFLVLSLALMFGLCGWMFTCCKHCVTDDEDDLYNYQELGRT